MSRARSRASTVLLASLLAASACAKHTQTPGSSATTTTGGGETTPATSASSPAQPTSAAATDTSGANAQANPAEPNSASANAAGPETPAAPPAQTAAAALASLGATREQQCATPARPTMNSSARRAFDDGIARAGRGDIEGARDGFTRALQEDRSAYRAAYNLGVLADRQGQDNQALEYYRQALRIVPDYEQALDGMVSIYLRRSATTDAVNLVAPIAQANRSSKGVQAVYSRALTAAQRYDEAFAAARQALACDERYVPALVALVRVSVAQGRNELAESILDQALQIDANNAEAHFLKGTMLRDEPGRLRDALEEFKKAVDLRPDYVDARMALGIQQLAGGNYDQAVQQFEAARQLAPSLVAVHLNLGDAYRSTKQWTQAKAEFDQALRLNPNLPEAHFNLGLMYQTASADFPGMDDLAAAQKAVEEFTTYRNLMGPRLPRNDPSEQNLAQLNKAIDRIQRRRQREQRAAQQASDRGTRDSGGTSGGATP